MDADDSFDADDKHRPGSLDATQESYTDQMHRLQEDWQAWQGDVSKKRDLLSSGSVDRDSYFAALEEDHRRLVSAAQELHKRLVVFSALSDQHKAKAAARGRTVNALRADLRAAAAQADAREERLTHLEAENRRLSEQVTQEVEAERRRADTLEREVRELRLLAASPAAATTAAAVAAAQARVDAPLPIVAAGAAAASSASSCGGGGDGVGSEPAAAFPAALEQETRGLRTRLREAETQLAAEAGRAQRLSALVGEAAVATTTTTRTALSVERRGRQQQQHATHPYQRATSASLRGGVPVLRARSRSASRGGGSGERHLNSTADGSASRSLDSRGGAVVVAAGVGAAVEGKTYVPRTELEAWVGEEEDEGWVRRYDRPIRSQRETDYWVPSEIFRYCGEFASRVCRGVKEEQFYPFMIRCNVIWHKEQAQALDALRAQHRAELKKVKAEARKTAKRMTQIEASIDLASLKAEVARVSRFKYHSHEHYVDVPTYKKFLLHALTAAQTLVGRAAAAEGEAQRLRLTHDSTAQRDHVCRRAAAVLAEVVEGVDERTEDFKRVMERHHPAVAPVAGAWCVEILSQLKVLCGDLASRI